VDDVPVGGAGGSAGLTFELILPEGQETALGLVPGEAGGGVELSAAAALEGHLADSDDASAVDAAVSINQHPGADLDLERGVVGLVDKVVGVGVGAHADVADVGVVLLVDVLRTWV